MKTSYKIFSNLSRWEFSVKYKIDFSETLGTTCDGSENFRSAFVHHLELVEKKYYNERQMKNKILFGVNSFFLIALLVSLFLPIDGTYMYAINLLLGILSFIFILVASCVKREKRFVLLLFLQLALLLFWYVLIACHYSIYKIGWKFYVCLLVSPIVFSHFFLAKQIFQKKRVLRCFVALLAFIFVKVVFFTYFYEFEGWKEYGEDIRDYSKHGQYKVLNERKLKKQMKNSQANLLFARRV